MTDRDRPDRRSTPSLPHINPYISSAASRPPSFIQYLSNRPTIARQTPFSSLSLSSWSSHHFFILTSKPPSQPKNQKMTTNPAAPLWLSVVRGIQLFLALVTLALSAYGISAIGSYGGYGLNIFTSVVTLFYIGYIVASSFFVQSLFNIWISLSFQAFLAIFWLATFGTLAALSVSFGVVDAYDDYDSDSYYYTYRGNRLSDISDYFRVVSATTKATTALAAIVWVLFVATLIYTSTFPTRTKLSKSPHLTLPSHLSRPPRPWHQRRPRRNPRAQAWPRCRPTNTHLLPACPAVCPAAAVRRSLCRPRRRVPPAAAAVPGAANGIPPAAVPAANGLPTADWQPSSIPTDRQPSTVPTADWQPGPIPADRQPSTVSPADRQPRTGLRSAGALPAAAVGS